MRQGSNSKRPRGKGGNRGSNGARNPLTRSYDSNGPGGRVRGNPHQVHEKYLSLARDAQADDPVLAENLLQHADHYFRLILEANNGRSRNDNRDDNRRDEYRDDDFGNEDGSGNRQDSGQDGNRELAADSDDDNGESRSQGNNGNNNSNGNGATADAESAAAPEPAPRRQRRPRKPKAEAEAPDGTVTTDAA